MAGVRLREAPKREGHARNGHLPVGVDGGQARSALAGTGPKWPRSYLNKRQREWGQAPPPRPVVDNTCKDNACLLFLDSAIGTSPAAQTWLSPQG